MTWAPDASPNCPYTICQDSGTCWGCQENVIWPPPVQGLAVNYFTPIMAPVPGASRLPQPSKSGDTVNGFLRIEAGGGSSVPTT
jgi:hypothetical protein